MVTKICIVIIAVIIIGIIASNVRTVPQACEFVIERFGKYHGTWEAGIHVKAPFIDRIVLKVSVKEKILDTPPQPVITKDNVTMSIDSVVYYHIFNTQMFAYGAQDPVFALGNLSSTTLRNIVGEMTLDETLTSRDVINGKLTAILDEATDRWGIKVERVELKNIMPPEEIRQSMEKEMKAERERRQTVLEAEGHRQAVVTRAEGDRQAMILEAQGERDARIARAEGEAKALLLQKQAEAGGLKLLKSADIDGNVLELKRFEALETVANGTAVKLIIPTDAVELVKNSSIFSEVTEIGSHIEEAQRIVVPEKQDVCCDDKAEQEE